MSLFVVRLRCETEPYHFRINVVERNGQLIFTLNTEKIIPEDAPVRLTDAQLEALDYRRHLKKLRKKRQAGRLGTHLSVLDSA